MLFVLNVMNPTTRDFSRLLKNLAVTCKSVAAFLFARLVALTRRRTLPIVDILGRGVRSNAISCVADTF